MEKKIEFENEGKNHICLLKSENNDTINIKISEKDTPKFNGKLTLKEIYEQIPAFDEYTIEEIFSAFDDITKDNIKIVTNSDKFELDFSFKVLKKEKHLKLEITVAQLSKDDLIQKLLKTNEEQKKRISKLEEEIEKIIDKKTR